MIKCKGVCDACKKEFDLDAGSFAVKIEKDNFDGCSDKWTVTILRSTNDAVGFEGFFHACGKTCLYRTINNVISRRTEEDGFRVILEKATKGQGHGIEKT